MSNCPGSLTWQRELWGLIGIPGIEGIASLGQQFGKGRGQGERCRKIESVMTGGIRSKIFGSSEKKTPRRDESSAMFRMIGLGELQLEVDKTTSQLNEAFVEEVVWSLAATLEPEMFQNIMGLVIVQGIEVLKVTEIARVKKRALIKIERSDQGGDALCFFHTPILLPNPMLKKAGCQCAK